MSLSGIVWAIKRANDADSPKYHPAHKRSYKQAMTLREVCGRLRFHHYELVLSIDPTDMGLHQPSHQFNSQREKAVLFAESFGGQLSQIQAVWKSFSAGRSRLL